MTTLLYKILVCAQLLAATAAARGAPKCCPQGQWLDYENGFCVATTNNDTENALAFNHGPVDDGVWPLCSDYIPIRPAPESEIPRGWLLEDGRFVYRRDADTNVTFSAATVCSDSFDADMTGMLYFLCPCPETVCVHKCCRIQETLSDELQCSHRHNDTEWKPQFYDDALQPIANDNVTYLTVHWFPECQEGRKLVSIELRSTAIWMYTNGSLLVENIGAGVAFSPNLFCLDYDIALVCGSTVKPGPPKPVNAVYGALFVVGALFALATVVCVSTVSAVRTVNTHLMSAHCVCLLCAYCVMASGRLTVVLPAAVCVSVVFLAQFFFLSAFLWLSVVCLDMARAFTRLHVPNASRGCGTPFLCYSLISWGGAGGITILTLVVDNAVEVPDWVVRPGVGRGTCWFADDMAAFAYFYGPMTCVLAINTVLGIYTGVRIYMIRRQTRPAMDMSAVTIERGGIVVYVKLSLLMGITWVLELVTWGVGDDNAIWLVMAAVNFLWAPLVFFILCCKREVWTTLRRTSSQPPMAPMTSSTTTLEMTKLA